MSLIDFHEELFYGSTLDLGKLHLLILRADTEMNRSHSIEEIEFDEIHWWVFRKETQVDQLLEMTEGVLTSAQELKRDSSALRAQCPPESYAELIHRIKDFAESHKQDISALYEYVIWLHNRDVLAPCILFTYRVWGSTRLADRSAEIEATDLAEDNLMLQICTEFALGLRTRNTYAVDKVHSDIMYDMYTLDPEYDYPISISEERLVRRASHRILDELATYLECLRQSLRNIILEIHRYYTPARLLNLESFWRRFITKAMSGGRVETELWDFKKSLEIWHAKGERRYELAVRLCELVAAFANTKDGVIVVGVTDSEPRRLVGVENLENNLRFTREVIRRHIDYGPEFVHFQQIFINDDSDNENSCLVIAIAQTRGVVSVKDRLERFSFPIRLETGLGRSDQRQISDSKRNIADDNYNFILSLDDFLED